MEGFITAFKVVSALLLLTILGFINIEAFNIENSRGFEVNIFLVLNLMILFTILFGGIEHLVEKKGLKLRNEIIKLFGAITLSPLVFMIIGIFISMLTVPGYYVYGITCLFLTVLIAALSRSIYRNNM